MISIQECQFIVLSPRSINTNRSHLVVRGLQRTLSYHHCPGLIPTSIPERPCRFPLDRLIHLDFANLQS